MIEHAKSYIERANEMISRRAFWLQLLPDYNQTMQIAPRTLWAKPGQLQTGLAGVVGNYFSFYFPAGLQPLSSPLLNSNVAGATLSNIPYLLRFPERPLFTE
jgi:hypothetical protein